MPFKEKQQKRNSSIGLENPLSYKLCVCVCVFEMLPVFILSHSMSFKMDEIVNKKLFVALLGTNSHHDENTSQSFLICADVLSIYVASSKIKALP